MNSRFFLARVLAIAVALIACAATTVHADVFDRPWYAYRSAHFHVRSDLPEPVVAKRIAELEQFRSVVLKITNSAPGRVEKPIDFYWFGNVGDFQRAAGSPNILGYMRPDLRGHVMAMRESVVGQMDSRHVVFHEFVHYLLRNHDRGTTQPKWYDEGLADVLGATRFQGDRVVIGGDVPERIQSLSHGTHVSLERVLTSSNLSDWRAPQVSVFYAKSYALVNYLHLAKIAGGEDRLTQLRAYLNAVNSGEEESVAFERSFGISISSMERELGRFLTRSQRPVLALPGKLFEFDGRYTRELMPAERLAYELGYLYMSSDPAHARLLLQREDRHLTDARFRAGVGVTYQMERSFDAAMPHLRAALALAPEDPVVLQEMADFLGVWCGANAPPPDCNVLLPESRVLYERLLRIEPDRLEAHAALGSSLLAANEFAAARQHFERVVRDAPWHVVSVGGLGIARLRTGDAAGAIPLLRRALSWLEGYAEVGTQLSNALREAQAQVASGQSTPVNTSTPARSPEGS